MPAPDSTENVSGRSEPRPAGAPAECDVRIWGALEYPPSQRLVVSCDPHLWRARVEGGKRLPFLTRLIGEHITAHGGTP